MPSASATISVLTIAAVDWLLDFFFTWPFPFFAGFSFSMSIIAISAEKFSVLIPR